MMQTEVFTFDKVFRLFIVGVVGVISFWMLRHLSDVLMPFAIAFLLAYLINPLVVIVQKKIPHRVAAVGCTILLLTIFTVLGVYIIVPMVAQELTQMATLVAKIISDKELGERATSYIPPEVWTQIRTFFTDHDVNRVRRLIENDNFIPLLHMMAKKVLPGMWSVVNGATSVVVAILGLFFIFLYLVFILMDYQSLKDNWKDLLPEPLREHVVGFVMDFDSEMRKYFRGQALVASLVGVVFMFGFAIIDLPMAIGMGMFIGVLNMVPYLQTLGFFPAVILAIIHALEVGSSPLNASLLVLLVFAVAQIIQDAILVPRIMGKVTGLSPAIILLSVSIWGKLFGMLGLVIALPMTCLTLAWYKRAIAHFDGKTSLL